MSPSQVSSGDAGGAATVARVATTLEVIVIPVSGADRAKDIYGRLGWRLDADVAAGGDFRLIQFSPRAPGARSNSGRT